MITIIHSINELNELYACNATMNLKLSLLQRTTAHTTLIDDLDIFIYNLYISAQLKIW